MVTRKGELSPASVDRGWPHQIAVPEAIYSGANHSIVRDFCRDLSLCPRGHAVFRDGQWYKIFCFAEAEHAEKFRERFGGEMIDPRERGRGANWPRWKKM